MSEGPPGGARRILVSLDEVDAVFFLPLPDPLALIDKEVIPTYGFIDASTAQILGQSRAQFVTVPHDSNLTGRVDATPVDVESITEWFRYCTVLSSLMIHHVETDVWARTGLDAASVVMAANFRSAASGKMPRLSTLDGVGARIRGRRMPGSRRRTARSARRGGPSSRDFGVSLMTVVEAVVPLRIVGGVPRLRDEVLDISERTSSEAEWPYIEGSTDDIAPRLSLALEHAILDIREFHRAYHAVTGDAITLLTRERLPSFLPVILRKKGVANTGTASWESGIVQVNDNLRSLVTPPTLTHEQLGDLAKARFRVAQGGPFIAFMDLHREASAALRRQGDTRMAAILCGVASESLLDELLLHLIWEEGFRPEDAAADWIDSLKTRVKREYAPRLGGQWDLVAPNPVTRWHEDVAQLRHRVVHGGYVPSRGEATLALSRLDSLASYLEDRVLQRRALQKYPRTAWMLVGTRGFERKKVNAPELRRLLNDPTQPNWDETFARWRDAVSRCRRSAERARTPDRSSAFLVAVRHPSDQVTWCLHDRRQHLAAPVALDVEDLPGGQRANLLSKLEDLRQAGLTNAVSFALARDDTLRFTETGPWVEEYHLVPMAGVMVDKHDLDRP